MFSKKKNTTKVDYEQQQLYENARKRSLQKKRLFQHFIIFLIGAVFLIVLNVVIGFEEDLKPLGYNWFVWAILGWTFIFLIHFFNVFVTNSFMGKEWENKEIEKLVKRQEDKIAELREKVERDHPLPSKPSREPENLSNNNNISPENPDRPFNT